MHTRTGLDTEYLGDEYMEMVKMCCDKAESENMLAWLYDEDRWSSGPAGGKVTRHKPYRRKRLTMFTQDMGWNTPKAQAIDSGEPYLLACYDVMLDSEGFLSGYKRIGVDETAQGTKWFAYCVNEKESGWFNGQTYIDAMDREAVGEFINVTHERYKEVIGERFDKSVPAIFTDEPNANHERTFAIPEPGYTGRILAAWSRFFEEEYKKYYGADILDTLPEIFWDKRDRSDSIEKYRYFDFIAEQFSKNYCAQIGEWCDNNGIDFTGHLLHEADLMGQATTCGETMRNYGYFGIPGIDILCDQIELTTAKQTQSAVHQYGKEGMLSELYGVTNWDFDFRGHKFQGDWQTALGVSVRVPHLTWLSMKGEAKRDYPASIGYQSPWFREYPVVENHFARVNTALTRGKPYVKIGVIHPIESYWISSGPNTQNSAQVAALEQGFADITRWMLESHFDFDYICESTLPSLAVAEDPSAVGQMSYDAIVVPGCLTLRGTTVEFLKKFAKAGKKVIFTGSCPQYTDGIRGDGCCSLYDSCERVSFDSASISKALEDVRTVGIRMADGTEATSLIYNYRQDTDCRWLFAAHVKYPVFDRHSYGAAQSDVVRADDITFEIDGEFTPVEYDTITGCSRPVSYRIVGGKTVIVRKMHAYDSLLLKLLPCTASELTVQDKEYTEIRKYDIKDAVEYKLSEPNVLLLDLAEYAFDDGKYNDREDVLEIRRIFNTALGYKNDEDQPYTLPKEPETHTLHLRYTVNSDIDVEGAYLALEDADKVTVTFNGSRVPCNVCGYFTDECISKIKLPKIKAGANTLVLDIPFGKRTETEWCYILGDFGVKLCGCEGIITHKPQKVGFGTVTMQGMPFYGANITYVMKVDMPEPGAIKINASNYRGSLIGVSVDGVRRGSVIFPPYNCIVEDMGAGEHTLELTVFGNRYNSFGNLHCVNEADRWAGPGSWRTTDDNWCYEYKVRNFGILKSPVISILK